MADPGLEVVKQSVTVIGEVMKIAKENPAARKAGDNLARSLEVVTETIRVGLLPLAAVNYGVKKAEAYFRDKFADDIRDRTTGIPAENLVPPKPSIAGPAMQGLAFSSDEDELRELYLQLLATAMNGAEPEGAHPAFVDVIRQLSVAEVPTLTLLMTRGRDTPIAQIRRRNATPDGMGHSLIANHVLPVTQEDGKPYAPNEAPAWVDNWIRLGLVTVTYGQWLVADSDYGWAEARAEYLELRDQVGDKEDMHAEVYKGVLTPTAFGARFAKAVGMKGSALPLESPDVDDQKPPKE